MLRQLFIEMLCVSVCPLGCLGQTSAEQRLANVQGKVIEEISRQGIRKVIVHLIGQNGNSHQEYTTATDVLGQFRVEGMMPGEYSVTVTRAGFVRANPEPEEASITVTAGQELTGLVYKMQATGVITGKITEADGDPLQGVTVWAKRLGTNAAPAPGNGPAEADAGEETTNDLGEYRIANLREGQYVMQAQPRGRGPAPNPADKGKQKDLAVYALTYYPGTLEEKSASAVRVTPGATTIANFSMVTSGSYQVSGVVKVAGNARNMQMFLVSENGQTEAQQLGDGGKFEFQNISPGTYVAQIVDGGATKAYARMIGSPIVVSNSDVTGLQLEPVEGGTVSGKVRTEDGENLTWAELNINLRRVADANELPQMANIESIGGNVNLNEDGSFVFKNVAGGTYQVELMKPSEEVQNYYVKSVMIDGREVVDTGFAVSGEMVLEVVMSAKGASLEGTVADENGQAVPGATVVSLPSPGVSARPDSYQTQKADAAGHFLLRGMNPGAYVLVALQELQQDVRKPEFSQKYGERGTSVDLDEGQRKTVVVNLQNEKP
jgi:Carboxypeptidase regulatory-like domain